MKKPNIDAIKLLGLGGTVLGLAASLVSSYASGKEQEATIEKKVAEAIAKKQ